MRETRSNRKPRRWLGWNARIVCDALMGYRGACLQGAADAAATGDDLESRRLHDVAERSRRLIKQLSEMFPADRKIRSADLTNDRLEGGPLAGRSLAGRLVGPDPQATTGPVRAGRPGASTGPGHEAPSSNPKPLETS